MIVKGWSDARFFGFLRSGLRRMFTRFPPKYQALAASKVSRGVYICAGCKAEHRNKDVSVDHIIPCGSLKKWEDVQPFIKGLFCSVDRLQVLCKECHYTKTMQERGMTLVDIEVAGFRKLKAVNQRRILEQLNTIAAPNAEGRCKQYRKLIDE